MRAVAKRMLGGMSKEKLKEWVKLVSVTGGAQSLLQAVSLISGLIVIRLLQKNELELACYTIANTMLGTISLLSDGGISQGVMSQGGKFWQDKQKLGTVLMTGLNLRRKFAAGALAISVPILIFLLNHQGASWLTILMIVLSLIPAFYAAIVDSLLEIVPKLHQAILPYQRNQVAVSLGRLLLTSATLFFFPFTYIAVLAAGIPRLIGNIKLRKIAEPYADMHQPPDKEVQGKILSVVKRVLPGAIYYCFSGQVTIWLISFFGKASEVGQLGGIGKITLTLTVFSSIIVTLVVPRFARMDNLHKLRSYFWKVHFAVWSFVLVVIFVVWMTADYILLILGPKFAGLSYPMTLSMIAGGIFLNGGISYFLYSSRGWVMNPVMNVALSIVILIIGVSIMDISTLVGCIKLDIFTSVGHYLIHSTYCTYKLYTAKEDRA